MAMINGIPVNTPYIHLLSKSKLISKNKKMQIDITTEEVVMPLALITTVNPAAAKRRIITSNSILFLFP